MVHCTIDRECSDDVILFAIIIFAHIIINIMIHSYVMLMALIVGKCYNVLIIVHI